MKVLVLQHFTQHDDKPIERTRCRPPCCVDAHTAVDVIDVGIAPTPTIEIAVKTLQAAGAIAITASHNPIEWNGLKFIGSDGMFLPEREIFGLFREDPDLPDEISRYPVHLEQFT